MVEQLPHCDLLRLILLTERFVLSARQVFRDSQKDFFCFCPQLMALLSFTARASFLGYFLHSSPDGIAQFYKTYGVRKRCQKSYHHSFCSPQSSSDGIAQLLAYGVRKRCQKSYHHRFCSPKSRLWLTSFLAQKGLRHCVFPGGHPSKY